MSSITILFIVFTLAVLSERKKIATQTGGADKAIVALLFVVVAGGGFAVAYALNDDVKNWVQGLFDTDTDNKKQEKTCSSHKNSEDCPSPSCEWDGNVCKEKDTPTKETTSHKHKEYKATPPTNKCSERGSVKVYTRLTQAIKDCIDKDKDPFYRFGEKSQVENFKIVCENNQNKIISTEKNSNKEENVDDKNIESVIGITKLVCKQKLKNSATSQFHLKYDNEYYVYFNNCRQKSSKYFIGLGKGIHINDKNKAAKPYRFLFEPTSGEKHEYLQTNTFYKVFVAAGPQIVTPTPYYAIMTNTTHRPHTRLGATTETNTGKKHFHLMFKRKHPTTDEIEPLYENEEYDLYHYTQDGGLYSDRSPQGPMKVYTGDGDCGWLLVSVFMGDKWWGRSDVSKKYYQEQGVSAASIQVIPV